ncbi:NUDIX hydrolase domain-like protein [Auriculariales sp. MPI-PUGE-AT-0066]|nr:NUDIX hydrolase domain-like protein [Auriculariales sp. MPI-PUGE-AT-0066]
MTFLPVVDACDNYRPSQDSSLVPFFLSLDSNAPRHLVGLLKPEIVAHLQQDSTVRDIFTVTPRAVAFNDTITTPEARSTAMRELATRWRDEGKFADVIGGRLWRDELYAIYANPFVRNEPAFVFERVCCALFGFVTYGVHMTVYTSDYKIWVPRRAKTKQTWAGMLDNTVAGGIPSHLSPIDAIVKEAEEEANMSEAFVRKHLRSVGLISYFYVSPKGWLQPEVEYVYEIQIPAGSDIVPRPNDGEVESFELLTVDEVKQSMLNREFKPNCAVVLLDFLIRHNFVTPENEPNLLEIVTRMHGRFEWDVLLLRP